MNIDIETKIREKFKSLRQSKKLSRSHIGELLKVSLQQVKKYEDGDNRLPIKSFYTLCEYFGVCPSRFLSSNYPNNEATTKEIIKKLTSYNKYVSKSLILLEHEIKK